MVNICGLRRSGGCSGAWLGYAERVTPVALQREREVPGHCETEAVVFNKSTPLAGQGKGNCTE